MNINKRYTGGSSKAIPVFMGNFRNLKIPL